MKNEKISNFLKRLFGWLILGVLLAGGVAAIGFIIALLIGGGEGGPGHILADFLSKQYFPVVIVVSSITIGIGLLQMYVSGTQALSIKSDKKLAEEELVQIQNDGN